MAEYSNVFGSNYPLELISVGSHKDIDDSVINLINQYTEYISNGNLSSAFFLYNQNKEVLKDYIVNAEYLNYLEEEIYNIGLKAATQYEYIQSQTEPTSDVYDGMYWIQEYE